MNEAGGPAVVVFENNLFFAVRITDVVRGLGGTPEVVDNGPALWAAIARWPALALIDLGAGPGWEPAVRRAKTLPQTRAIPIVAFGSHVDSAALAAARAAGCDHAWARARFMTDLPRLVESTLHPPPRTLPGCDAPPAPALLKGIAQFNRGEYWECHETLEALWRAEPGPLRDLYQGILQIGVAFHHLSARNYEGTLKMLRRGLPRLRGLPPVCQGVPVDALARAARAIHDQVVALGPERISEFDLSTLPAIHRLIPEDQ